MVHCRVQGRVQGVGFRWFVQETAERLQLCGSVQNTPDGAVEIVARGEERNLQRLLEAVRMGPPGARVTRCEVTWGTASGSAERGFRIRY